MKHILRKDTDPTSVATSLPLVWCKTQEKMDVFGRCGDIVASASTMAADSKALTRAINLLQSHACYAPQSLSGIGMIASNGPTIHPPISTHE